MHNLLVICGPTATGKTRLAVSLAQTFDAELISADSRQIYKGMDIGTGKDIREKRIRDSFRLRTKFGTINLFSYDIEGVPIWLYDVVSPDQPFSVSHYQTLATAVIKRIHDRNKLPILVGGSGLYIKAVTEGIGTFGIPKNEELRKELEGLSVENLQKKLQALSPEVFDALNESDRKNPRRLLRKIEIVSSHTSPFLSSEAEHYTTLSIGLTVDKDVLTQKIIKRVETRVQAGIGEEIRALLASGFSWDLPALNTLGYKEWRDYIDHPGEEEKKKALSQWIQNEANYAKKQMTWFKKQPGIVWFDIQDSGYTAKVDAVVRAWYTQANAKS